MTLVGKILTVLILLLSLIFLWIGITINASHQNWQAKARENKVIADRYYDQIVAQQAEISKKDTLIETEKVQRAFRIAQLETQLQLEQSVVDQLRQNLGQKEEEARRNAEIARETEARLAEQDKNVADLQARNRNLTEYVAKSREKMIENANLLFELEGELRQLQAMRDGLAAQNAQMAKVMFKHDLSPTDLTDHIPPAIEGTVVAVTNDTIALSLGTDDGILKGHKVDIFRGNRFVGTAEVTVADPNKAAARIDRNLTKFAVETGDRVTTVWNREQK